MSFEFFLNDNYIQIIVCLQIKIVLKIALQVLAGQTYVKIQKKLNSSLIEKIFLYIHLNTFNGVYLTKKVSKSRQIIGAFFGYIGTWLIL